MSAPGRLIAASALVTGALVAGCSQRALYEFNQGLGKGKADCAALTAPDARRECEASFAKDYATYIKERKAL